MNSEKEYDDISQYFPGFTLQSKEVRQVEDAKYLRRKGVFLSEGLSEKEATALADQMWNRDRDIDWDDRKLCFECTNYVGRKCMGILDKFKRPTLPTQFLLQRCEKFNLKGKK